MALLCTIAFIIPDLYAQEKSFSSFLKEGELNGKLRNYFMGTANRNGKNFYANAIGGLLGYQTTSFKGFKAGISGSATYKGFSSNLNAIDTGTGESSKWEKELFNINSVDYTDLYRLEELFISYQWQNSYITHGKIPLEYTPLLNISDGRMIPFAFQGTWLRHTVPEGKWLVDAGWIHRASPRSTSQWNAFDKIIGMGSNGFQPNATKADYHGYTPSKGIGIIHFGKHNGIWHIDLWNLYLDKFINTSWFQLEYQKQDWHLGAIWSYQIPHNYQGRLVYGHRYVQPDENGQVLSLSANYKFKGAKLKAAYSKAFATGRYLFPRELGRDQFYTSMSRSRMEGYGDMDVLSLGFQQHWKNLFLNVDTSTSFGASTTENTFNKYNADDFYQVNTRLDYEFSSFLKGLKVTVLYVWKENKNEHLPELVYQKSDYNQLNLITNFNF